jgi:MFS family permease
MATTALHSLRVLLQNPAYRCVWLIGILSNGAVWLEMLVAGVYAFDTTGSPFLVALLVVLRLLPLAIFGSLIGTLADRTSPRLLLSVTLVATTLVSASVFLLFLFGYSRYWVVAAASFVSGMIWATDMPLRRRILGDIVGIDRVAPAMSFDTATSNATRMIGPFLGGLLYQELGISGAFALSACLYGASAALILRVPTHASWGAACKQGSGIMNDFREVFTFVARDRDVLRILLLTVVFNVWAFPFLSMIPVLGRDELVLSASWIGLLAALEGAGAFLGALAIAIKVRAQSFRRIYYLSILIYLLFALIAGLMNDAFSIAVILLCIGLAGAGFSTMQSTLIYSIAPPHMRSRLFGLVVICIGTGLIGMANMGLMGEWFGGSIAVRIVAAEGLVPLLLIGIGWRQLSYHPTPTPSNAVSSPTCSPPGSSN